tara:strand:- start:7 stop:714 length:708 start_codon:yes stop_codon:yes gene_type:complete
MTTIPDIKLFVCEIQHDAIDTYDIIALKAPTRDSLKKIKKQVVKSYLEDVIDEIDILQEELENVQQSMEVVRRYAYNKEFGSYMNTDQLNKSFQKKVTVVLNRHKVIIRDIMKVLTSRSLLFVATTFPKEFQQAIDNFVKLGDSSDDKLSDSSDDLEEAYMSKLSNSKIDLQYIIDMLVAHEFISTRSVADSIKKLFDSHVVYALLEKREREVIQEGDVTQEDHSTPEEMESPST